MVGVVSLFASSSREAFPCFGDFLRPFARLSQFLSETAGRLGERRSTTQPRGRTTVTDAYQADVCSFRRIRSGASDSDRLTWRHEWLRQ
jgi:hypothetical protein